MNTYILQTKPRQENKAAESLLSRGYDVFNPKIQTSRKQWGKMASVFEPLFPGYLFINLDLTDTAWLDAKWTPGIQDFLKMDNKPAIIDPKVMDNLKQIVKDGIVDRRSVLKFGDKVKVTGGPMKDLEGVFQAKSGMERSIILVKMITEDTRLTLDNVWLERA